MTSYTVILYYKYIDIDDVQVLRDVQFSLCKELGLKGRVLVAKEGINGTLEGPTDNINKYIELMRSDERFKDIVYKTSGGRGKEFAKLFVRVRDEIVTTGIKDKTFGPHRGLTGKYLSSEELHSWYKSGKDFVVVDLRNDYEYEVGRFKDSIIPQSLSHFRDITKILPELEHLKNVTIVTCCTGGVRCEVASGFLMQHGYGDVYQLKDGIHTYMERYPDDGFFEGGLYVFDARLVWRPHNSTSSKFIGKCRVCGELSENMVNWDEVGKERLHGIICINCCMAGKVALQDGNWRKRIESIAE
jgi:UPF0176 protein